MHFEILLVIFFASAAIDIGLADDDDDDFPVLTIKDGQIRGTKNYTVGENITYYAFRGIPYAEPPLDDLRFRDPVKNSNWTGILNATEDKEECVQFTDPVTGVEDCLYINVYTPSLTSTNITVMVWIHGGAFIGWNSSYKEFGPDYLLEHNIVFVSLNYRLGIFGFLSTEDEACSGNWGLKDQVLALKWVQSNIAYFGGNPDNITVFGESAGAACISYLLQTNKTLGLFNAAIMQSGTSLDLWALNRKASETAFRVGNSLGIITTSSTVLVEYLRKIDYTTLQSASETVSTAITLEDPLEGIFFGPVIEPDYDGAIFVNNSEELLSQGGFHKIPVIMGFNSNEAAIVGAISDIMRIYLIYYDVDIENLAPRDLTSSDVDRLAAAAEIKEHYLGLEPIAFSSDAVIEFVSDDQWYRPIRKAVLDMSQYVPVYMYKFSYAGILGGVENRNFSGVGHSEDLGYLFRRYYDDVPENDTVVRSMMVKMWTNFAKYGNPTPAEDSLLQNTTWEIAGSNSSALKYLNIDLELAVEQNPYETNMKFYDNIYSDYGEPPYDTY